MNRSKLIIGWVIFTIIHVLGLKLGFIPVNLWAFIFAGIVDFVFAFLIVNANS